MSDDVRRHDPSGRHWIHASRTPDRLQRSSIVSYGRGGEIFVGDVALALATRRDDAVEQEATAEVWALDATQSSAPPVVAIPDVPFASFATLEVGPGLTDVQDATFVVTAVNDDIAGTPYRTFLERGSEVRELPFNDARGSFGPVPEIAGD